MLGGLGSMKKKIVSSARAGASDYFLWKNIQIVAETGINQI